MKSIKQEYLINVSIEKVWQALTDSGIIEKWGAGPAKMNSELGAFSLWGGDIYGKNTKIIENKLLEQDWISGKWKNPSRVKFELEEEEGKTKLILSHKDFPEDEGEDLDEGWREYYLGPLKDLLEK